MARGACRRAAVVSRFSRSTEARGVATIVGDANAASGVARRTVNDGVGCRPQDHGSPNPIKVGDYSEPSIFAGGSAPTLLPWVSLPLVGVRTRIGDDVALRIGLGASATGI